MDTQHSGHICWLPLESVAFLQVLLLIWEGRLPQGNQAHWGVDSTQQLAYGTLPRAYP